MPPKVNNTEKAPQKKQVASSAKTPPTPPQNSGKNSKKTQHVEESVEADQVKDKKPGKYDGVEKGECPNLATAFAGLHLNVERVKAWLKRHYSNYKVERKVKTVTPVVAEKVPTKKGAKSDGTNTVDNTPRPVSDKVMLNNANFALGAVEHSLCLGLIELIYGKSKKAGAGLYTLSEQDLMTAIEANKDYNHTFGRCMYGYFPSQDYVSQLMFEKKELPTYIEQYGFNGGNSNVNMGGVLNLIAFLLLQSRTLLADTAYWSTIAKKGTTVSDRSILYAIPVVYQGKLKDLLFRKCEDVMLKISGVKSDDSENGSKKGSKQGSKKVNTLTKNNNGDEEENEDNEDVEDEDEEEEEEPEDEDEEEEEEADEEPEPVKPVKKGANTGAKKPTSSSKK